MRDVDRVTPSGPPPRRPPDRQGPRRSRRHAEEDGPQGQGPAAPAEDPRATPEDGERADHIDIRV